MNKLNLPTLIIPVFRGGDDFKRCLATLKDSVHLFSKICISINGSEPSEDEATLMHSHLFQCSPIILKTNANLPPVHHIIWITRQLKSEIPGSQRVFLLCHDDELNSQHYAEWLSLCLTRNGNIAWIGSYKIIDMSSNESITSSLPDSATDTPLSCREWLTYNSQQTAGHVFTNASGICVPFRVLDDVAKFWAFTHAKTGGRFEYMMLSHKSIEGISCCSNPIVTIHESLGQAGRSRSDENLLRDEVRYSVWLILNARDIRDFLYISKSQWGGVSVVNNLKALFKIEFGKLVKPVLKPFIQKFLRK
jgi:hypothetical protein